MVQLLEYDYGSKYLGASYVTAKIVKENDTFHMNVAHFDYTFATVRGLPRDRESVPFDLKISDEDAVALGNGLVKFKVRDLYFIGNNGDYPWGQLTFVK